MCPNKPFIHRKQRHLLTQITKRQKRFQQKMYVARLYLRVESCSKVYINLDSKRDNFLKFLLYALRLVALLL